MIMIEAAERFVMKEPISDVRRTWGMGERGLDQRVLMPIVNQWLYAFYQPVGNREGRGVNGDQQWWSISSCIQLDP